MGKCVVLKEQIVEKLLSFNVYGAFMIKEIFTITKGVLVCQVISLDFE
jgi:hypothetical protein